MKIKSKSINKNRKWKENNYAKNEAKKQENESKVKDKNARKDKY